MTEEQALEVLDRAASQAAGTRSDHEVITEAVKVLKVCIEKHKEHKG